MLSPPLRFTIASAIWLLARTHAVARRGPESSLGGIGRNERVADVPRLIETWQLDVPRLIER
jgi:hypothetical protein